MSVKDHSSGRSITLMHFVWIDDMLTLHYDKITDKEERRKAGGGRKKGGEGRGGEGRGEKIEEETEEEERENK